MLHPSTFTLGDKLKRGKSVSNLFWLSAGLDYPRDTQG